MVARQLPAVSSLPCPAFLCCAPGLCPCSWPDWCLLVASAVGHYLDEGGMLAAMSTLPHTRPPSGSMPFHSHPHEDMGILCHLVSNKEVEAVHILVGVHSPGQTSEAGNGEPASSLTYGHPLAGQGSACPTAQPVPS